MDHFSTAELKFSFSYQKGQRANCKCFCYFGIDIPHQREGRAEISIISQHHIGDENAAISRLQIGIF